MSAALRALVCLILAGDGGASDQQAFHDDFDDLSHWSTVASDGVSASIHSVDEGSGKALRLDFDFQSGAGFCVVRRKVDLTLPSNYRFAFRIRGEGSPNNLEFKLADPSSENVWWVNKRDFELPREWREVRYLARHFKFAWGPSGGRPLEKVGWIEFAVAAGSGGKGSLYLDEMTFEELPLGAPRPARVRTSSRNDVSSSQPAELEIGPSGKFVWESDPLDSAPWIAIDLGPFADTGGLAVQWAPGQHPGAYELLRYEGDSRRETLLSLGHTNGGWDYLPIPEFAGEQLRLEVRRKSAGRSIAIQSLQVMPPDFGESPNAMLKTVAQQAPLGWYPAYLLSRQTPWTAVGAIGDDRESLMDVHGAVEVEKLGYRVEPFLLLGDKLITWADAQLGQSLEDDYLPIPTVTWATQGLKMDVTVFADGEAGRSCLVISYRIHNVSSEPTSGSLFAAIRPFQVLPPWHELNITGGAARVTSVHWGSGAERPGTSLMEQLVANFGQGLIPAMKPSGFGSSSFSTGEIIEHIAVGHLPSSRSVVDDRGLTSGALRYDFALDPGEDFAVLMVVPLHDEPPAWLHRCDSEETKRLLNERLQSARMAWSNAINRVQLSLPSAGKRLADTFKTVQAHILINADGPAIQPGSRTYERSWIRDGALTSAALLSTGHPEQVKAFLDWYAGYLFPDGKVPCVVDHRGADPVPEHDSTGEYLYALLNYYRFTRDRDMLERHWPKVVSAVGYLEKLRAERLTNAYRDGPPEKRACYGLVPESISHEGYSAKPMHSYWDNFFVLKGLGDAAEIALILGRSEEARRFGELAVAFRSSLYDSMRLAMSHHKIDYVPGCVELGDFDATSTAIGVFPCGELGSIPEPQLRNTFDRYFDFFTKRRDGAISWKEFTPYELRLVGTFVRLGQRERAHALLDFFLGYQTPSAWNQWPEVNYRDPHSPGFAGDIPHTWVGGEFINAFRSMFVYEAGDRLELLAGIAPAWLEPPGIELRGWPTHFGLLDLNAELQGDSVVVRIRGNLSPPGGCRMHLPFRDRFPNAFMDGQSLKFGTDNTVLPPACAGDVVLRP